MIKETQHWLVIPASFLIAILFTLLPMPEWSGWFRPAWVLLVLIYWAMLMPYRVNVGTAWMIGLVMDVLNGSLLGEHALAFTLVTYLVIRMHMQLRMYPLIQQSLWVFLFVVIYQFVLFCVQGFLGDLPRTMMYWSSSITSMLLWPWMCMFMRDYQRRSPHYKR